MPGKNRNVKQISLPAPVTVGSVITAQAANYGSPARPLPPAPDGLVLTTTTERNAATPTARISATWVKPTGVQPERYTIQWSRDSTFPDDQASGQSAAGPSATIPGLKTATIYYVRVSAWVNNVQGEWSSTSPLVNGENEVTTASDTVPASQPASLAGTWIGTGDLQLNWVNPTEENFKEVEVKIYAASGGTLLRTVSSAAGRFLYTAAMNLADTSGVGDPSLFVEARSRTFSNITNNTSVPTLTTTKSAPTAPTLTHSWTSDTGAAGADLTLNWTAIADAAYYSLNLNGGTARRINGTTYTYSLDRNIADNTTADPTITYSLTAVDGLGQSSTAVTGTATNAAPAAPATVTMTTGGVSTIGVAIGATKPADFASFSVRVIQNGGALETITKSDTLFVYQATTPATYQFGVKVGDVFGQLSSETLSSAVPLDFLTTDQLRADSAYTDSIGTDYTSNTYKVVLKDDSAGGGVTYAASASAYRWTQIEHPLIERIRRMSVRLGSGSANFYIATSQDGSTWRWFAGLTSGYLLTERVDEATAQANTALTTSLTYGWCELPITIECRYIKLYHRHTSSSYRLDEYYAYTLVVADMIRAGDVQTLHLGAGAVTADKISVTQLAAIAASMGALSMDGVISIASGGGIYQGSGTFASPTTGLKFFNSGGTGKLSGYNGGTEQITIDTDGKLKAGAGTVLLDANGIGITSDSFTYNLTNISPVTVLRANAVEWTVTSGQKASISGSTGGQLLLRGQKITLAIPLGGSNTSNYGLNLASNGAHLMAGASFDISDGGSTSPSALSVAAGLTAADCTVKTSGNVGIGVGTGSIGGLGDGGSPRTLQVHGAAGYGHLALSSSATSSGTGMGAIVFASTGISGAEKRVSAIAGIKDDSSTTTATGSLYFYTTNADTIALAMKVTSAGHILPMATAGTQNLGDATNYFGDVSYKTLTDRGCLALIDAWELSDGRMVSAREAILSLRVHPSKRTVYGEPMLDYESVPRHSFKPAPIAEADEYAEVEHKTGLTDSQGRTLRVRVLKQQKGDRLGEDGVEMTALFSMMVTHHRELIAENEAIQARIAALEAENTQMRGDIASVMQRLAALEAR